MTQQPTNSAIQDSRAAALTAEAARYGALGRAARHAARTSRSICRFRRKGCGMSVDFVAPHQPPAVYAAIGKVIADLAKVGIAKDRRNQGQGAGFMFRGIDDVYNALAP